jgi:hypothetical protein
MFKNLFARLAGKAIAKKLDLQEGPMDDKKKWFKSKGVWTGIVTVALGAYELARVNLAPQFGWNLPEVPSVVLTVLGTMGVYSRMTADKKIG